MSWSKIDNAKEASGLFIKLKSGDSIDGVFVGEPYCYYQVFGEKAEHIDSVPGSSFRFKINVAVAQNGGFTMKILNGGLRMAKSIRKLTSKVGFEQLFQIEREGSGKDDTVYHIIPLGKLTPQQVEMVKKLKKLDLASQPTSSTPSFEPPPFDVEDDIF